MAIFVLPSSPECQVANTDECEIHLLVVYPEARGQGVASHLIGGCENEAVRLGYFKIVLSTQQSMEAPHHVNQRTILYYGAKCKLYCPMGGLDIVKRGGASKITMPSVPSLDKYLHDAIEAGYRLLHVVRQRRC